MADRSQPQPPDDPSSPPGDLERLRQHTEASWNLLVQHVKDFAILLIDPAGRVATWNSGAEHLLGYSEAEILGQDMDLFFTPEDRQLGLPQRELATAATGSAYEDENWVVRKDGSLFWGSGVTRGLHDQSGQLLGFIKILRDHSRRHQAEHALCESEERLRVALAAARMGTWLWNIPADRQSLDTNLSRLLGLPDGAHSGSLRDFLELIDPRDRQAVADGFARSASEGVSLNIEFRVALPGGEVRWIRDQGNVLRDAQGRAVSLTGACMDITDRKQMEEELARARDQLELRVEERTAELIRSQQRVLQAERLAAIGHAITALAHESRNAIQRGQNYLERLSWRLQQRPEEMELLQEVRMAQDDLLRLYESVRDYAGPLQLSYQDSNLPSVWHRAWATLDYLWQSRGDRLEEETAGLDLRCRIDPFRLEQVFRNIFENSLTAGQDSVTITLRCAEEVGGNQPSVRLSVRDTGPGLNAEQKERLFEAFFSTKARGTGLGMAIARRIVEAHGGQISVGEGPGAEIIIVLPRSEV